MPILSEKARKFISGRIGQFRRMKSELEGVGNIIWVHSCSYGEFEEIRPVLEMIHRDYPDYKLLATFFSPSGYEHLKDDPVLDYAYYLPLDFFWNRIRFFNIVRPVKCLVSISDFWLGFLGGLRRRKIPTYLVSACFVPWMSWFKPKAFPYRAAFRNCFTEILVRDSNSRELMESIGVKHVTVTGDPRMDRVIALSQTEWRDETVDKWCGGKKVFVAGSTLQDEDSVVICDLANSHPDDKFLIIPHEIGKEDVEALKSRLKVSCAVYSEFKPGDENANVLIVNTIGMLAKLYRYGFAAYVGSGFDCSPHSILEPASYGMPVSYGPLFGSYCHCQAMIDAGAGFSIGNSEELAAWYDSLRNNPVKLKESGEAALRYCLDGSGAAGKIVARIMAR